MTATRRVLVVDHDAVSRELLAALLGNAGFHPISASDGLEALALARTQPRPDLILLDLVMPHMNGWEFRLAQRADAALADIPVIALSVEQAPHAAAIDADAFLSKPFDRDVLLAEVERVLAAAEVRQSREQLALGAAILESQHDGELDGLLVISAADQPLTYNRRFVAMWGLPAEVLARGSMDAIADHNAALLVDPTQIYARRATLNTTPEYRDELILKDGRTFERHSMTVAGAGGKVHGRMIFFRDISEARHTEQALRASQHRLRALLEATPGILCEFDGDGRYLDIWTGDDSKLVRPRDQLLGRTLTEAMGEAGRPFLEVVQRVQTTGQRETLDYALETPTGTRWFAGEVERAPVHPGIAPTVLFVSRDITEKQLASLEHQRMAAIIAASTDAVIGLTAGGIVEDWNPGAERLFGYTPAEIRGQHVGLLWPEGKPDAGDIMTRVRAGNAVVNVETTRRCKDGSLVEVSLTTWPILDKQGKLTRFAAILRDITEPRRLRAQLVVSDRLASVGTLAAGVAHEINNPLAYVGTNLAFALEQITQLGEQADGVGPDELRRVLSEVREALVESQHGAQRVAQVVGDLKIFSRGNDELIQPLDVRDVLDATLKIAHNEIRHRAQLVRSYQAVPRVLGNEGRLGQVFLNLVMNAAQAITEGAAESHRIEVKTARDDLGRAVIEVSDTGAGIRPEQLGRVFDPFFTTKAVGVGTGLGLAICHGIVTGMGGQITVASPLGRGTTFRVVLPAAPSVAPREAATAAGTSSPSRRLRMLLIDDEPALRRSIARAMRPDHDVVSAADGRDALEILASDTAFDLILTDVMMPEITGIDLYLTLRDQHPELLPRVVFMTGGAFTPRTREFLDSVPNPTLAKPFAMADLRGLLATVKR